VDGLDGEVVVFRSRTVVHRFVPCASSPFIEHYITRHVHTLCPCVKNVVGLRALRVADEHPRSASVVELAAVSKLHSKHEIAKDPYLRDCQLAPMPSLVRCPTVESFGGRAVEDVDSHHHQLFLEDSQYSPLLEKGQSHPHNHLVALLNDIVLLQTVRRRVVALNTLICSVRYEFSRCEFIVIVGAQHAQLVPALCLCSGLCALDGGRSLSLAVKEHNPHVAGEVINEQQEQARGAPWLESSIAGERGAASALSTRRHHRTAPRGVTPRF
jgi:hypothetical protein